MNSRRTRGKVSGAPVVALFGALLVLAGAIAYASFSPKQATSASSASAATSTTQASTSHSSSTEESRSNSTSTATSSSSSTAVTAFQSMPTSSPPQPLRGVLDPANGDIYRENTDYNTVSVISGTTNTVVANVSVGAEPSTVIFDAQNGDIYVANSLSDFVSVISGATNTVVANVTVVTGVSGSFDVTGVQGGIFDPTNGDIYLTSDVQGAVFIISGETNTLVGTVNLNFGTNCDPWYENPPYLSCSQAQDFPSSPVFDPTNGYIYVSNSYGNTVSVISGATNSLLTNVVVGGGPGTPAIDSANGNVYVPNSGVFGDGNTVSVISGATNAVIATVMVGDKPEQPVFNPVNGDIYLPSSQCCVDASNNTLSIISGGTNALLGVVPICGSPYSAFVWSNGDVYVPCQDGTVWAISSTTTQSSTTSSTTLGSPGYCSAPPDTNLNWVPEGNDYVKVVTNQSLGKVITNGTLLVNLVENDGEYSISYAIALGDANGTGYVNLAAPSNVTAGYYNVILVTSDSMHGPCYTAAIPTIMMNPNSAVFVTVSVPSGMVTVLTSNEGRSVATTTTSATIIRNGG